MKSSVVLKLFGCACGILLIIYVLIPTAKYVYHVEKYVPQPVPVTVSQRAGVIAAGKVAVFTNPGNTTISVVATFKNASFQQEKQFNLVLSPGQTKEIGSLEGWTVEPGETVELSSEGYSDAAYKFHD
jgi:hypothetical protein